MCTWKSCKKSLPNEAYHLQRDLHSTPLVLHEGGRAEEILNGDPITVCTACMEYADLCVGSSSSNGRFSDSGADMHGGGVRRAVPGARLQSVQSVVRFWYLPRTHLHTHRFMRRRKGWRDRSIFGVVIVHVYGWSRGRPAQIPGTHQRHPAA